MIDYPYILVLFLEETNESFEFERWPHHVTLLPWFKANSQALTDLERITRDHLPLEIELTEKIAMFGVREDIKVRLVSSPALHRLHTALLTARAGLLGLNNSRYTGQSFKPHVTLQGQQDPTPGQLKISTVSLVKKLDPASQKKRVEKNLSVS